MADAPISSLTDGGALQPTDLIPIVRAGSNFRAQIGSDALIIACSDEATPLVAGTNKVTFRMPFAFTLSEVRAGVATAPTGQAIIVDVNEEAVSILSTRITIDVGTKTSTAAGVPPVISDVAIAEDAEISVDFDQVGSIIAGSGLKVTLIGARA